jgi:hypothetical protein
MDYYGDITQDEEVVMETFKSHFRTHSPKFVQSLVYDLRARGTIPRDYSITGWRMYACGDSIRHIQTEIAVRTQERRARLAFLRGILATVSPETIPCDDILRRVTHYLNVASIR